MLIQRVSFVRGDGRHGSEGCWWLRSPVGAPHLRPAARPPRFELGADVLLLLPGRVRLPASCSFFARPRRRCVLAAGVAAIRAQRIGRRAPRPVFVRRGRALTAPLRLLCSAHAASQGAPCAHWPNWRPRPSLEQRRALQRRGGSAGPPSLRRFDGQLGDTPKRRQLTSRIKVKRITGGRGYGGFK